MKKTKSDFLKVFREKFEDQALCPPGAQAELAAVMAAESVGVAWEPEEEPLPERLYSRIVQTREGARLILVPYGVMDWDNRKAEWRGYYEVLRRYHAWPELREAVTGLEDFALARRILAILEGMEDDHGK